MVTAFSSAAVSVDVTGAAWKRYKFDPRSGKAAASGENRLSSPLPGPRR